MVEAGGCVPSLRAKLPKATSHAAVLLEEACTRHTCSCVHASLRAPGVVHVHEWADMQRLGADVTSRVEHKAHTLTPGGVGHLRAQACTCLLGVRCQRQAGATSEGGFPPSPPLLCVRLLRWGSVPAAAAASPLTRLQHTRQPVSMCLRKPCPHVVCHTHTRTRNRGFVRRHSPSTHLCYALGQLVAVGSKAVVDRYGVLRVATNHWVGQQQHLACSRRAPAGQPSTAPGCRTGPVDM